MGCVVHLWLSQCVGGGFVLVSPDGLRGLVSASGGKEWVTSKGAACVRSSTEVFHRWRLPGFPKGKFQNGQTGMCVFAALVFVVLWCICGYVNV